MKKTAVKNKAPKNKLLKTELEFIDLNNFKKGIDVSHHQGAIDWDKVSKVVIPNEPIRFVYIKTTEGATISDLKAETNAKEAKRVGLPFGYYHFAFPENKEGDAVTEAKYFIAALRKLPKPTLAKAYVLDLEKNKDALKKADYLQWILAFIAEFETYSTEPLIIYGGPSFLNDNLPSTHTLGNYPLWLAHYQTQKPTLPVGWTEWLMWQWSEKGSVNGIAGNVDLNWASPDFSFSKDKHK